VTVVRIPPTLRDETGGQATLEARGDTVREVLEDVAGRFPALRERIYSNGDLAPFVNVYVEGEDVRTRDGLKTAVSDGSTVILLPAMAGGRLASLAGEGSRPAKPASALAFRWQQDAALAGLVRARSHCPAPRELASFASERPENRG
jgi:molybdopterin synthase sulfur carrier subunit